MFLLYLMHVSLSSHFVNLPSLESLFSRMHGYSSSYFWILLLVGENGQVCCAVFMTGGTCACVLMGEAGSCHSNEQ